MNDKEQTRAELISEIEDIRRHCVFLEESAKLQKNAGELRFNPKFLDVKSYNLLIFDKLQGFYAICTHVNHVKRLVLFGFL